jgi:hypothetical protein
VVVPLDPVKIGREDMRRERRGGEGREREAGKGRRGGKRVVSPHFKLVPLLPLGWLWP